MSSESVLIQIRQTMKDNSVDMIEALIILCDENGIDIEDVIKSADTNLLDQLRHEAVVTRRVRGIKQERLQFE